MRYEQSPSSEEDQRAQDAMSFEQKILSRDREEKEFCSREQAETYGLFQGDVIRWGDFKDYGHRVEDKNDIPDDALFIVSYVDTQYVQEEDEYYDKVCLMRMTEKPVGGIDDDDKVIWVEIGGNLKKRQAQLYINGDKDNLPAGYFTEEDIKAIEELRSQEKIHKAVWKQAEDEILSKKTPEEIEKFKNGENEEDVERIAWEIMDLYNAKMEETKK